MNGRDAKIATVISVGLLAVSVGGGGEIVAALP